MIIFKVDKERFEQEYRKRTAKNEIENVEWFVDDNSIINMFIVAATHIYHYSVSVNEISEIMKIEFLTPHGKILGIEEIEELVPKKEQPDVNELRFEVSDIGR